MEVLSADELRAAACGEQRCKAVYTGWYNNVLSIVCIYLFVYICHFRFSFFCQQGRSWVLTARGTSCRGSGVPKPPAGSRARDEIEFGAY